MLQISAIEYPILVDSGIILMGFSTALIPVRETEDGEILWHLEVAKDNLQLKVSNLKTIQQKWLQTEDFDYLQSKKAILGWCSEANILLGTDQLAPSVSWSDARLKRYTWHWRGANLQALAQSTAPLQIGGQIGLSFERTPKVLQFDSSGNYTKCLRGSTVEQIVLYDFSSKRAWLVSVLSVLHHMLLVYLNKTGKDLQSFGIPMTISRSGGSAASLKALKDKGDVVIDGSGSHALTVRQLILKLSINLSRAFPDEPMRSVIHGYEFMDVVMEPTLSVLKKTHLRKEGLAWSSLLSEVNCLFCSDLGDAIAGRRAYELSSPCNILPPNQDFLAASMESIEWLSAKHGGKAAARSRRLSHNHFWQLTGSPFVRCRHTDDQNSCWCHPDFLQEIQKRRPSALSDCHTLEDCTSGALVFGGAVKTRTIELYVRSKAAYLSERSTPSVSAQELRQSSVS